MRSLYDDEQLTLTQPVDQVVGLADVSHDGQVVARRIEHHGVVRCDQPVGGVADQRDPRVLIHEPSQLADVGHREGGVLAHPPSLDRRACLAFRCHRTTSGPRARVDL